MDIYMAKPSNNVSMKLINSNWVLVIGWCLKRLEETSITVCM